MAAVSKLAGGRVEGASAPPGGAATDRHAAASDPAHTSPSTSPCAAATASVRPMSWPLSSDKSFASKQSSQMFMSTVARSGRRRTQFW